MYVCPCHSRNSNELIFWIIIDVNSAGEGNFGSDGIAKLEFDKD